MANDNDTAPAEACIFNEQTEVTFAKGDGETKNKFSIVGYSGGVMKNHWYWGNLAIDLDGCKFYKKPLPVLESHCTGCRVGFTTKQTISDNVTVEGEFLANDNAQAMQADMAQGFPMEASLFCPPSVIERVLEGASVKVNGQVLKGPGAVFRKSIIKEVSMCVFGLDKNTKSSALADIENVKFSSLNKEHNIMETEIEITNLEGLAAAYPELCAELSEQVKTEVGTDRDLFAALKEACGDDHELLIQCFSEQKTPDEARQLRIEKLQKEKTQLTEKNKELETKKKPVDPAATEFADSANPPIVEGEGKGDKNEEALKQEFAASADLQEEFGGDVEAYVSFKKADAEGRVRIAHQKT